MKTINKVQKTGSRKFNNVMSIVIATVVGFVLISFTVLTHVIHSNKPQLVESFMSEGSNSSPLEISNVNIEKALEYNPQEFVNAEIAEEKESLISDNAETVNQATELEHQVDNLMNETEYKASKFEKEEMSLEIENWMDNQDFLEAADAYTANGSVQEVAKYAQKQINAAETESASEMETWMTDKNFFQVAEVYTAKGSELEVEKYAEKQIIFKKPY